MDPRLHDALDDELDAGALTPAQLAELEDARALFDGVARAIPSSPLPPLGASVLRRIGEVEARAGARAPRSAPSRRGGFAAWLWSPHQVSMSIRPAYALAAAAVLTVAVGLGGLRSRNAGPSPVSAAVAPAAPEILVQFRLDAPQAQSVTLAGDFSNWTPAHAMRRSDDGVWTIVVPLAPGVHEYAFVVDGQRWVPDPAAPSKPDGFGGVNSRVAVLGPDARS